jgi:hypothetical protein
MEKSGVKWGHVLKSGDLSVKADFSGSDLAERATGSQKKGGGHVSWYPRAQAG